MMKKGMIRQERKQRQNVIDRRFMATRGGYRRLLSIGVSALLSISTFLTVLPQTETIVYADNDKTITGLCTGTIGNPASGAGGWSYVYYGKYNNAAMKYRVLDKAATQFNTNTTMLLDCDSTLINKAHDSQSPYEYGENGWTNSEIKAWLNGDNFYGSTSVFTAWEKAAIAESTKGAKAEGDGNGYEVNLGYAQLTGEHVFLLDAVEATRQSYGYADQANGHDTRIKNGTNGTSNYWWLRSPHSGDDISAGRVGITGDIHYLHVNDYDGVSPALNLNLESVIFSSVISGTSGSAGAAYKLTIADSGLGITPGTIARTGTTITVPYTITGTNKNNATQVSVLLLKNAYSAGGSVINDPSATGIPNFTYLKLNTTDIESGSGSFTLPEAYTDLQCGTGYYAYILAEDVNIGNATDYASVPASITIPDLPQVATPTFTPAEGTYTEAQNVEIKCDTAGADIYYTTDGSEPSKNSGTKYTSAISVSDTTTIKAIAVKDGMADSEVAEATYTIIIPGKVATPTFTPAAGTYTEAQNVAISCATEGATIYYTTDGTDPTSSSSAYSSPITVSETTTIKAIAVKDGMTDSQVAEATYTIEEPPTEYRTINFDPNANDASGKMDPQKIEKGKTEKLNENKYTREGYTFDSWNTTADGSGEKYADKQPVKLENDMTLYAQWTEDKPEEYTVTVTVSPEKSGTATASVSSGKTGTEVTLKAVSKAGYKFKKWKVVSGSVDLADATKTKTTFAIKDANVKVKAIFEKIYEAPQPEIEPVGDDGIILAWWKVDEAEGYDIFMSRCNHGGKEISPKLVKTIEGNETFTWTATGLKPNKSYKALIKAYVTDKNGKKKYISKSPLMHVYTAGGNKTYTNPKSVKLNTSDGKIKKGKLTLKVKDTYKIKASVKKADSKKKLLPDSHVKTLRYRSSDPGIATVSSKGKITAKKKGKCNIYVYAHNGVNKTIKVTVK